MACHCDPHLGCFPGWPQSHNLFQSHSPHQIADCIPLQAFSQTSPVAPHPQTRPDLSSPHFHSVSQNHCSEGSGSSLPPEPLPPHCFQADVLAARPEFPLAVQLASAPWCAPLVSASDDRAPESGQVHPEVPQLHSLPGGCLFQHSGERAQIQGHPPAAQLPAPKSHPPGS